MKVTVRKGSKPGPAAKDLQAFITEKGFSIRAASDALDVTHPALIAWLNGDANPSAINRKTIEAWTGGRVAEEAWLSDAERKQLAKMRPANDGGGE